MKFQGALIKEQGVSFAIVIVKPHVLDNRTAASEMQIASKHIFGNIPIVLMAQNSSGRPTYLGREDIVNFLSKISISRIPWQEYTLS